MKIYISPNGMCYHLVGCAGIYPAYPGDVYKEVEVPDGLARGRKDIEIEGHKYLPHNKCVRFRAKTPIFPCLFCGKQAGKYWKFGKEGEVCVGPFVSADILSLHIQHSHPNEYRAYLIELARQ